MPDHQFGGVTRRLDEIERRLDRMEERLERTTGVLRHVVDATRSDLTRIALAVGTDRNG